MLRMIRKALLSLTVAAGTTAVAPCALADYVPPFSLLTRNAVPANGVLRFPVLEGTSVRIVAEDGVEVPGGFVAPGFWRPDAPFELGRYTADVSIEPNPAFSEDREFEVIAAMEPSLEFLEVQVASSVQAGDVLTSACCGGGAAEVGFQPCTSNCKPLCVPLTYEATQVFTVTYVADSENPLAEQTSLRMPASLEPGQYVQGVWTVEGAPTKLCGVAEVFSWLDDSVTLAQACIENPKPDLSPIAEAVTSFGGIAECTLPPPGYETQWCAAQAYSCLTEITTLSGDAAVARATACMDYYDLCGVSAPGAPGMAPADGGKPGDAGAGTAPQSSGSAGENDTSARDVPANDGCQMSVFGYQSRAIRHWAWLAAGLLAAAARRRVCSSAAAKVHRSQAAWQLKSWALARLRSNPPA